MLGKTKGRASENSTISEAACSNKAASAAIQPVGVRVQDGVNSSNEDAVSAGKGQAHGEVGAGTRWSARSRCCEMGGVGGCSQLGMIAGRKQARVTSERSPSPGLSTAIAAIGTLNDHEGDIDDVYAAWT